MTWTLCLGRCLSWKLSFPLTANSPYQWSTMIFSQLMISSAPQRLTSRTDSSASTVPTSVSLRLFKSESNHWSANHEVRHSNSCGGIIFFIIILGEESIAGETTFYLQISSRTCASCEVYPSQSGEQILSSPSTANYTHWRCLVGSQRQTDNRNQIHIVPHYSHYTYCL